MTTIVVTGRHRPHEVLFLVLSTVAGCAFVAGVKPPTTLEQLVPGWVLWTWYLLLLFSGAIGLASFALRDTYRALLLESAAMNGQAAAPLLYGLALVASGNGAAAFAIAFCATWAAASVWRGQQVRQGMRALRQASESGDT
ncbi:hypothetical protein ABZ814_13555 [Micromonospora musae]|uniref:hypothetical protein n=1 Tax=Micromonospora musae TaxID=1894970 RepID=UPI0033D245B5